MLPKLEDPVIVEEGDRSSSMTAWDGLFLDVVAAEEDAAEATEPFLGPNKDVLLDGLGLDEGLDEDGFDTEEVVQMPFRELVK